jgi:hypothetical protein
MSDEHARRRGPGRPFPPGYRPAGSGRARRDPAFRALARELFGPDSGVLLRRLDELGRVPPRASARQRAVALQANTLLLNHQQGRPPERVQVSDETGRLAQELSAIPTMVLLERLRDLIGTWPRR